MTRFATIGLALWAAVAVLYAPQPALATPCALEGATPAVLPVPSPRALGELALPHFCSTHSGFRTDPVNMVVAASQAQLEEAFARAGWLPADPINMKTLAREAQVLVNERVGYPTSPMSDLYLFGRKQDYAFQKNARGIVARDHLRVWRTSRRDGLGRPWWAIAATRDIGIKFHEGLPTHRIAADIDAERTLVLKDLLATGSVAKHSMLRALAAGFSGRNGARDPYFTDGQVVVLELGDTLESWHKL